MLRDLDELILPAMTHWNHPRFFAWIANTGSEPGILAELLIAALNVNGMTWLSSPAATELELTVLDWLAQLLGLPRGWHGHIEDTASTSMLAALAAARDAPARRCRLRVGAGELQRRAGRAARRSRLPQGAVDDAFRMRADFPLDDATAVVATVGTTSTTSVDPVPELARRCEEAGVWLHVDAAYAGAAAVCPELRWCLDGCDRADSLVVNPHKWLFTPMDCSAFWTRRPEVLHETFALVPEYLAATEAAVDIKDYGPALGRRFRALKLWFVLRWYGAEGLRALIREHVRLAQLFASWVEAEPGWEVVAPHPFSIVCFRHVEADNDALARAVTATGEAFIAHGRVARADDPAARDRQRGDDGGRRSPRLGGAQRCARDQGGVFDLWETLVDWDRRVGDEHAAGRSRVAPVSSPTSSTARWDTADNSATSAPIRDALRRRRRRGGARSRTSARCDSTTPGARSYRAQGAVETLRTLRERGFRVGLITVCSEDVEVVCPETELAGLFDAEVFSNAVRPREARPADLRRTAARCSVSSRTRRCSSATARTTSSTARGASAWRRS